MGRDKAFDLIEPRDHHIRWRHQIGNNILAFGHGSDLIFHRFHPTTMKFEQTNDAAAPTTNQKTSSAMEISPPSGLRHGPEGQHPLGPPAKHQPCLTGRTRREPQGLAHRSKPCSET